ncbi:RNA methyltransferase [Tessaracoccus rhinocerotis]|uniref:RNA methyltransferase n=1 Tax=Tessaracoccus rhinocerotis TaxID=1689449 RepID=A0A553K2P9_9ACTN|nr:RNA methyltransferase [Tessaracoccus rhinocerotis]TRY18958.1 RNA methyltransferase [Tessaracoccus rhinocerotis]
MLVEVTDAADPRLGDYVSLRDSKLRRNLEQAEGLFIAEGEKIIRRAAEAGARPRSFLLQERWLAGLDDVLAGHADVPCYVVSAELAERVSGFHVHRGALASYVRPPEAPWEQLLGAKRLVVCEDIVDHTNIGSILRVAAALGWGGVVVSATCADPLYRRAVKSSMGASLQLPWRRMADDDELQLLRAAGFTLVAATLTPGSVALDEYRPEGRVALLLGNEGHGLSRRWQEAADVAVTIPMAEGIDSLNVATAAAVMAYVLR